MKGTFQVKVLDFGLAKFTVQPLAQTIDHANTLLGSIYFMAPEQFRREPLDRRTDLYALGCVFYYTLTGRHPFSGESVAETMACHLRGDVSSLALRRPDLPAPVSAWVMSLLSLAPDDRPADATEALDGLQTAVDPAAAVSKPPASPADARGRKHRRFLWLGSLCLAMAVAVLGGYSVWHRVVPAASARIVAHPSVSLFASVSTAHAQGRAPGCFTLVRSGDQSTPVTVTYSIHGSAKNGVDYEKIETTRTIPAGETSAKIVIVPMETSDRTREDRHVRLTLQSSGTYTVATPDEVKLKIVYDH